MPEREALGDRLARLTTELLRYRSCLFDPETRLPTLPVVLEKVRRLLDGRQTVQVLLVRVEHEQWLETLVGWQRYDDLLCRVAEYLGAVLDGSDAVLCQFTVRDDDFLLFSADPDLTSRLAGRISSGMRIGDGESGEAASVKLRYGEGTIRRRPTQRVERCVYAGVAEAFQDFERRRETLDVERRQQLRSILSDRSVTTLFQPIFSLPDRSVIGFEALSRGPGGTYLEPAENLFGFAERDGLLGEVESLCLVTALEAGRGLDSGATLFANLSILGMEHLESSGGGIARTVEAAGWQPRRVVLEITERTYADRPKELRRLVEALREQGFRIAIDDMGTGYSSLHMLADLQPDFIKLDQTLVRGLDHEPIKRNLVSAILGFAASSSCQVIAEGVEDVAEVDVLQELGVTLAQGFHLGLPEGLAGSSGAASSPADPTLAR